MKYGIFCEAAIAAGVQGPRYVAYTKKDAERMRRNADAECQSKAKHIIRKLDERGAKS